jgi:hypothetical protein
MASDSAVRAYLWRTARIGWRKECGARNQLLRVVRALRRSSRHYGKRQQEQKQQTSKRKHGQTPELWLVQIADCRLPLHSNATEMPPRGSSNLKTALAAKRLHRSVLLARNQALPQA